MSLVVATRLADGLRLEIDAGSSLIVGNMATTQVHHREALFSYLLVAASPEVLKHSTIEARVLHPYGIGLPPSDPMQYIRKLKLSADRKFESATGERGLIASIRGLGYRLTGEWELAFPRSKRQLDAAIMRLRQLAMQCVALMKGTPLMQKADGALVLDTAVGSRSLATIGLQVQDCIQGLVAAARPESHHSVVIEDILADIFSYFTFSREGSVEEDVWRQLFERELMRKIDFLVRQL